MRIGPTCTLLVKQGAVNHQTVYWALLEDYLLLCERLLFGHSLSIPPSVHLYVLGRLLRGTKILFLLIYFINDYVTKYIVNAGMPIVHRERRPSSCDRRLPITPRSPPTVSRKASPN